MKTNLVAFFSTTIIFALLAAGANAWYYDVSPLDPASFLSMLEIGAVVSFLGIVFSKLFSLPVTSVGYCLLCAILAGGAAFALSWLPNANATLWTYLSSVGLGLIGGWGGARFTALTVR